MRRHCVGIVLNEARVLLERIHRLCSQECACVNTKAQIFSVCLTHENGELSSVLLGYSLLEDVG